MSSFDNVMFQLTSGFINETAIPNDWLQNTEIINAIQRYNWIITPSTIPGWINIRRHINYSS